MEILGRQDDRGGGEHEDTIGREGGGVHGDTRKTEGERGVHGDTIGRGEYIGILGRQDDGDTRERREKGETRGEERAIGILIIISIIIIEYFVIPDTKN